jgi:hypothetical protein
MLAGLQSRPSNEETGMCQRYRPLARALFLGACCALAAACSASFSNGLLPAVTYEQLVSSEPKPSIGYDAVYMEVGAKSLHAVSKERHGTMLDLFHGEIKQVLDESRLFSGVNSEGQPEAFRFSFVLQRQGEYDQFSKTGVEPLLLPEYVRYFAQLTLGLIPSYRETARYHLLVEVKKADRALKRYEYRESMHVWVQFPFLLFLAPTHTPDRIQKEIIDGMLLVFLRDYENDRRLSAKE